MTKVNEMSKLISNLKKMRNRATARHELDMLSSRQLRDLNLERVTVVDNPVYQRRFCNAA